MFNLTPSETFKEVVKVQVKTEGGIWREESFTGIFQRTPEERRAELNDKQFREVAEEVLVGWEMLDMQRMPVEFNPPNKAALLGLSGVAREITIVYLRANSGAKAKN